MKSLLQRLPSKEKEWKAVARAKEKFYGDAFAREAAVCRASLRAAASAPGDAKRCGADAGASVVVPLADHPKARVGVPACETAGSPNSAAFSIRHNSGVRLSDILLHCRMPPTRGECQLTAMIAIGPRW
jgi:hypothetical protein